jgi:antibiotic biosynthesis monooxygenase (ABM) superfamily enzyme
MIIRLWHGWARGEDADRYLRLLDQEIAPAITARAVPGLRGLDVLRRVAAESDDVTEFVTLMVFDDEDAVAAFAGPDRGASVVPPAARALLDRYDSRSQHYEVLARHRPQATDRPDPPAATGRPGRT